MKVKRAKAKRIILERCSPIGVEEVTIEKAKGRVLAQDVTSPVDIPDDDKSAIDGFAFKTSSLKELPARLKIVGESPAGAKEKLEVKKGEAVYVATGGVIPRGADAAVRVEDVRVEEGHVVIDFPVERGTLINFKGSEIKAGEVALKRGELLDWRKLGLLAHLGVYRVKVFQRVKVGVITTGTEVLEPEEPFRKGAVRNTNFYALKGLIEGLGAEVIYLGRVKDEPTEVERAINQALSTCNVVVTTGGVSKGKYDLVKDVVKRAGVELLFTQTNIRPGRPLTFGVKGEKLFFGLPGYPAAMAVNALEFLAPALRKLMGMMEFDNKYQQAIAAERLKSRKGRVDFVRVNLSWEGGVQKAYSAGSQQTSNFLTFALCQGLAVIGEDRGAVEEGEVIDVLPL